MGNNRQMVRSGRNRFLGITIFTILFSAVYEYFSHGVYSDAMIFAFAVPLCMVVLPYTVMLAIGAGSRIGPFTLRFYQSAVLTILIGRLFAGVLEIYGTTNRLEIIYPAAGAALLLFAVLSEYRHYRILSRRR